MGSPTHDAAAETPAVEVHADNAVVNTAEDGGGVDNNEAPDTSSTEDAPASEDNAGGGSDSSE